MNDLVGIEYPTYTVEEASKVGSLFMLFSNLWDEWQNPLDRTDRTSWRFKNRKHIPNMNYLLCQIHWLLGIPYHNRCFPVPTTKNSLSKIKHYYQEMLKELLNRGSLNSIVEDKKLQLLTEVKYKQLTIDTWITSLSIMKNSTTL